MKLEIATRMLPFGRRDFSAAVHESAVGTSRTLRTRAQFGCFVGEADVA
jgi:hypothetical protein